MSHKLGIIVPYRDRYKQLLEFKSHLKNYLDDKDIKYELIIVEQDGGKAFNRGKLLNIGFLYAKKLRCNYVVFHDIDMLPVEVDYSYSDKPLHMATNFISDGNFKRIVFDEYFGGVTMFPINFFEQINGYSNKYWGWGYEDTELLHRCELERIPLDKLMFKQENGSGACLKFNGENSYVEANNIFNLQHKNTILITFNPNDLRLNHEEKDDMFASFGIPGYDFLIGFSSYSRYVFQIFDSNNEIVHLESNITTNHKVNMIVTIDTYEGYINMYLNGELIDTKKIGNLRNYIKNQKHFYLGAAKPKNAREQKFFKGTISNFAVYNDILDEKEIKEISSNQHFGLTQNFGDYVSDYKLITYYDAKFIKGYKLIDLSGHNNDGQIYNCEIVRESYEENKIIDIPYRRNSTFRLLPHEENGYFNNGWKTELTRFNQLRFYNEIKNGYCDYKNDGLSDCDYVEHSRIKQNNVTHAIVGI